MAGRTAVHILVSGRVQGVGFRAFTWHTARQLGLAGWVRNLPDGTVEVEAEGESRSLEDLERRLRQGPPASRVSEVAVTPSADSSSGDGFEIRYF